VANPTLSDAQATSGGASDGDGPMASVKAAHHGEPAGTVADIEA